MTFHTARKIMENSGIHPQRLALDWASAAEAPLYVSLVTRFTNLMRELGPMGEKEGIGAEELGHRLNVACQAARSLKLRSRLGRLAQMLRKEKDYSPGYVEAKIAERIQDIVVSEMRRIEAGSPHVSQTASQEVLA